MPKQNYLKSRRLRVFGGPNGSGKSTILNEIDAKYDLGYYINADVIEKELRTSQRIDLVNFGINDFTNAQFNDLIQSHTIIQKANTEGYHINLFFEGNSIINPDKNSHSYEAAFISDILRQELLKSGKKFAYETVMSHASKIQFLKSTQESGYKNYLYYISTESPIINIARVEQRVKMGGHPVASDKIESRYFKSLENLKEAVQNTYRTFIFDNSTEKAILILEVFQGKEVTFYHNEIPHWVDNYLLK